MTVHYTYGPVPIPYPDATATIYNARTGNLATLYDDNEDPVSDPTYGDDGLYFRVAAGSFLVVFENPDAPGVTATTRVAVPGVDSPPTFLAGSFGSAEDPEEVTPFDSTADPVVLGPGVSTTGPGGPAEGDGIVAIGKNAYAPHPDAVAIGHGAYSDLEDTPADDNDVSLSSNTTAIGTNAGATAAGATALGADSYAQKVNATALGKGAQATGSGATAAGVNAVANGPVSTAVGGGASASSHATAVGDSAIASVSNATAVGVNANASHVHATAVGAGATTTADDQVALGDADATVVVVGQLAFASEVVNVVPASGAAETLPAGDVATIHNVILTNDCTLTFPDAVAGASFRLVLRQDEDGGHTVTWPSNVRWPNGTEPTLSSGANDIDVFQAFCANGVVWLMRTYGLAMS